MENNVISTGLELYERALIKRADKYMWLFFASIIIILILVVAVFCLNEHCSDLTDKVNHLQNSYDRLKSNMIQ